MMLDRLFFVSLVLSATGLFRFIAPFLNVTIGQVSLSLLIFNLFYLMCRHSYIALMFPILLPWFVLLFVWPLATLIYAPIIEIREVGIALNGFTLLAGTAVYTVSNGLKATNHVFLVSLILTVFGLFLNLLIPFYFHDVAFLSNAQVLSLGRPGGFYMQPNVLAIGLAFLFVGWFSSARRKTNLREPFVLLGFLGLELLTGARAGMILGVFIVILHFGYQWREQIFRVIKVRYLLTRMAIIVLCLFIIIFGAKKIINIYGYQIERNPFDLLARMETFLKFRLTEQRSLFEDISVQERLRVQKYLWELIKERPLFGHGLAAETWYYEVGTIWQASHNMFLSITLQYGCFYSLSFIFLMIRIMMHRSRHQIERFFGTNFIVQIIGIIALVMASNGNLFDMRFFYVLLGLTIVLIYYPNRVLFWDKTSRNFYGILTKKDIGRRKEERRRRLNIGHSIENFSSN